MEEDFYGQPYDPDVAKQQHISNGLQAGTLRYSPDQKQALANHDAAISWLKGSNVPQEVRDREIPRLMAARSQIEPSETPMDELPLSPEQEIAQQTHMDSYGVIWGKDPSSGAWAPVQNHPKNDADLMPVPPPETVAVDPAQAILAQRLPPSQQQYGNGYPGMAPGYGQYDNGYQGMPAGQPMMRQPARPPAAMFNGPYRQQALSLQGSKVEISRQRMEQQQRQFHETERRKRELHDLDVRTKQEEYRQKLQEKREAATAKAKADRDKEVERLMKVRRKQLQDAYEIQHPGEGQGFQPDEDEELHWARDHVEDSLDWGSQYDNRQAYKDYLRQKYVGMNENDLKTALGSPWAHDDPTTKQEIQHAIQLFNPPPKDPKKPAEKLNPPNGWTPHDTPPVPYGAYGFLRNVKSDYLQRFHQHAMNEPMVTRDQFPKGDLTYEQYKQLYAAAKAGGLVFPHDPNPPGHYGAAVSHQNQNGFPPGSRTAPPSSDIPVAGAPQPVIKGFGQPAAKTVQPTALEAAKNVIRGMRAKYKTPDEITDPAERQQLNDAMTTLKQNQG